MVYKISSNTKASCCIEWLAGWLAGERELIHELSLGLADLIVSDHATITRDILDVKL